MEPNTATSIELSNTKTAEKSQEEKGNKYFNIPVSVKVTDIDNINTKDKKIDIAAVIIAKLKIPTKLAARSQNRLSDRTIEKMFKPKFDIPDTADQNYDSNTFKLLDYDATHSNSRVVQFKYEFDRTIKTPFDIHLFPFDNQDFEILMKTHEFGEVEQGQMKKLKLIPDKSVDYVFEAELNKKDSEWRILSASIDFNPDKQVNAIKITIQARRRVIHALINYVLPIFILSAMIFFYWTIDEVASIVEVALALVLAIIFFAQYISTSLPSVGYMTYIQYYCWACLIFVTLITISHIYMMKQIDDYGEPDTMRKLVVAQSVIPFFAYHSFFGVTAVVLKCKSVKKDKPQQIHLGVPSTDFSSGDIGDDEIGVEAKKLR